MTEPRRICYSEGERHNCRWGVAGVGGASRSPQRKQADGSEEKLSGIRRVVLYCRLPSAYCLLALRVRWGLRLLASTPATRRWSACQRSRRSPINISPVPDSMHTHDPHGIGDFVHDAVIAHANPPIVLCPGELAAAGRAGTVCQRSNRLNHPVMDARRQSA